MEASTIYYYIDEALSREAGVVKFIKNKTEVHVPTEVTLRGRHAPVDLAEPVNYLELLYTADDVGNERLEPFAVRAKTGDEFDDWLRTFNYMTRQLNEAPDTVVDMMAIPASVLNKNGHSSHGDAVDDRDRAAVDDPIQPRSAEEEEEKDDDDIEFDQAAFLDMDYYYQHRHTGDQHGPVRFAGLRNAWKDGEITAHSYVYPRAIESWVPVGSLPILHRLLSPPKPPPPPKEE